MTIHTLILAGGSGTRLGGVRKADLRLGGKTMLEWISAALQTADTNPLISVGPVGHQDKVSARHLPDLDTPLSGPLAGLVAATEHLAPAPLDDVLVTVAVDTPFLPDDYVRRLVAALDAGADAAMATWKENFYPTNAIWRLSVLMESLPQLKSGAGPRSPKALLAQAHAVSVDWGSTHLQDPFTNLNTLDDVVALAGRAIAHHS